MRNHRPHPWASSRVRAASLGASLSIALCASLFAAPAHAVSYHVLDLGQLTSDRSYQGLWATDINNLGQVVGYGYNQGTSGVSSNNEYGAFISGQQGVGLSGLGGLGGSWSQAFGINNQGQAVGTAVNGSGQARGFYSAGAGHTSRDLGTLGGPTSSAAGINDHGQVVGAAATASGLSKAYLSATAAGALSQVGLSTQGESTASGVNNAGQVTGWADRSSATGYSTPKAAYVTAAGGASAQEIPISQPPGSDPVTTSRGLAINAQGRVAGEYGHFFPDAQAFLTHASGQGQPLNFSTAGNFDPQGFRTDFYSHSDDVNASGQVVGSFYFSRYLIDHAFITGPDGSQVTDVNNLSFTNLSSVRDFGFVTATGINDQGQFVANGSNGHAYLLTPVPEPLTVSMMGLGLGLGLGLRMLALARRRGERRGS